MQLISHFQDTSTYTQDNFIAKCEIQQSLGMFCAVLSEQYQKTIFLVPNTQLHIISYIYNICELFAIIINTFQYTSVVDNTAS